jgi:hypothetical protein
LLFTLSGVDNIEGVGRLAVLRGSLESGEKIMRRSLQEFKEEVERSGKVLGYFVLWLLGVPVIGLIILWLFGLGPR